MQHLYHQLGSHMLACLRADVPRICLPCAASALHTYDQHMCSPCLHPPYTPFLIGLHHCHHRYEYRAVLALALGLPLLQQACGINAMVLYSSEVCARGCSSVFTD